MDYLEEVAIQCAKGIVDKKISLTKEKGMMQSKWGIFLLFHFISLNLKEIDGAHALLSLEIQDYVMSFPAVRNQIYKTVHGKVMKQSKGLYPAPLKIIEVSAKSLLPFVYLDGVLVKMRGRVLFVM